MGDSGHYYTDNVFYINDFDDNMVKHVFIPFYEAVVRESLKEDGHIDMFINSYGGEAHLAFHLVSLMEKAKSYGVTVRTIVTGAAMSCGSYVSVAGTPGERYVAKDATFLIHYGQVHAPWFETPVQNQRHHEYTKRHFKKILDHYNKYCDIPDLADKINDDLLFITSAQARRWSMADKDIAKLDLLAPNEEQE